MKEIIEYISNLKRVDKYEIANKFDVSESHVRRILKSMAIGTEPKIFAPLRNKNLPGVYVRLDNLENQDYLIDRETKANLKHIKSLLRQTIRPMKNFLSEEKLQQLYATLLLEFLENEL